MELAPLRPRRPLHIGRYILLAIVLGLTAWLIVPRLTRRTPAKQKPAAPQVVVTAWRFEPADLFDEALARANLNPALADSITALLTSARFDFRHCLPDDTLRVVRRDTSFLRFEYQKSYDRVYVVGRTPDGLRCWMLWRPTRTAVTTVHGVVRSSLYQSVVDLGESPELVFDFTDILGGEVDFLTESQPGDSFAVVVEKKYADSVCVGYGPIQAVRYAGAAGDFAGIRFTDRSGVTDYYDLTGQTMRRLFLRSPLHYRRISSFFSLTRRHPILRIVRPHLGIDYVAPAGTPVSALGDGRVSYAGPRGGYGNFVELVHPGGYRTHYGHLLRIARGTRVGATLEQGEVLGYVGSTGLSTGPHLHFEMIAGRRAVNPLKLAIPRARTIAGPDRARFDAEKQRLLAELRGSSPSPE